MKKCGWRKFFLLLSLITVFIVPASSVGAQNMFRKVNDFDGDGRADYAVTRNENGYKYWYIWQTTEGFKVKHWGLYRHLSRADRFSAEIYVLGFAESIQRSVL